MSIYDRGLGPVLFAGLAANIAGQLAAFGPLRVLETAASTGILTRELRNLLPASASQLATDLNPPTLDGPRKKFGPSKQAEFRPADATALPLADGSFDAVNVWDRDRYNPLACSAHEVIGGFFPPIRRNSTACRITKSIRSRNR